MFAQVDSSPESSSTPSLENNDGDNNGSGSQDEVPQDDPEATDNGSEGDNTDYPGNEDSSVVLTICPDGTTVTPPVECLPWPPTKPTTTGIDTRNTTTPTDELMINQTGLINNDNVTGTETETENITAP